MTTDDGHEHEASCSDVFSSLGRFQSTFLYSLPALFLGGYTLWSAGPGLAPDHIRLSIYLGVTWWLVAIGMQRDRSVGLREVLLPAGGAGVATLSIGLAISRLETIAENGITPIDIAIWALALSASLAALTKPRTRRLLLGFLGVLVVGYVLFNFIPLMNRAGGWNEIDLGIAVIAILVVLELARRGLGPAMPIIAIIAMVYAYFGPYFPEAVAHRGLALDRIANYLLYSQEGIYGVMSSVMANIVLVFILLGAFMNRSGMGKFFIDFPMALAGRSAGGPAKVAVFASGVFGSISGSSLANIVSTGTFTIPLMKKVGFKPTAAGAIENSASLGGQLLPPVMGAGVFVMAEITGVPYAHIVGIATVPALLYFLSIGLIVHFEAKKCGISGLPEADLQRPRDVLRKGWFHVLPFLALLAFLISGYSPDRCALIAILTVLVINWIRLILSIVVGGDRPEILFGPREICETLVEGVKNSLVVGSIAACVGLIVGTVAMTGFGLKLGLLLVSTSGGVLFFTLLLVALASLVLGMALPITASYLVMAVLAGPALESLGVPLIAAHMIVFWLSQDSNITPPVSLGAFVAASIAKADPWPTAWLSFKFAKMLYVMPILFAYTPILFTGSVGGAIWTMIAATFGTIAFTSWSMGYFVHGTSRTQWLLLGASAAACFIPPDISVSGIVMGHWVNVAGVLLLGYVWLSQKRQGLTQV